MIFFTSTGASRAASPEELARAEDAMAADRRRSAALGLFARRMTHDMSNFITVVRTYSELLLADLPATSTTHADVLEIHRAADAMVDYLQHVARFARSGGTYAGTVVLDELIGDLVEQLRQAETATPGKKQITLRAELRSAALVRIDATWLVDIMRELITNAEEASPTNGTITVRSWRDVLAAPIIDMGCPIAAGNWAIVEIADEGAGLAPEVREQAVDPFVTTKQGVRGAGFGLSLARNVTSHAGGHLVIDDSSHDPTSGTRVRLWFPEEPAAP